MAIMYKLVSICNSQMFKQKAHLSQHKRRINPKVLLMSVSNIRERLPKETQSPGPQASSQFRRCSKPKLCIWKIKSKWQALLNFVNSVNSEIIIFTMTSIITLTSQQSRTCSKVPSQRLRKHCLGPDNRPQSSRCLFEGQICQMSNMKIYQTLGPSIIGVSLSGPLPHSVHLRQALQKRS